jgi:hypothetical protein
MEVWSAETVVPRSLLEAFRVGVPEDCPSPRVKVWVDCTGRCGVSYVLEAETREEAGVEAAERAIRNFFPPRRNEEWTSIKRLLRSASPPKNWRCR